MAKLDNKKILACCANGAGSSLMMEKAIDKVMKKYNNHLQIIEKEELNLEQLSQMITELISS